MNSKNDIIAEVHKAGTGNATKADITAIVSKTFAVIGETLAKGEDVRIADFGTFSVTERPERPGRNPATGEAMTLKASRSAKFKAAAGLKNSL